MAMRTGKTKVILDDFGRLEAAGQCMDLLVIAPASVYATWLTAIEDHVSEELRAVLLVHLWRASANMTEARGLARLLGERVRPRVLLLNVEALSSVERAREAALAFARSSRSCMVVVDESTRIKTYNSKRAKFIVDKLAAVPAVRYRRVLSGLPTPQSPLDLYMPFKFLNPNILGYSNFIAFRARYAVMKSIEVGGRAIPMIVGYRDEDEIADRIAPHAYRCTLEQCYDLPPSIYMKREVALTEEQARIYRELKAYATAEIEAGAHVTATQIITLLLRLHQCLCGHTRDEEGRWHAIPEKRTDALMEVLAEYDGKAIVWCTYDADVQKITNRLVHEYGETSVARFWGGNRATREQDEARFKSEPHRRFMVATASAGGMGRTWDVADHAIYYSRSYDLEHNFQSEERIKNVGKVRSALYTDLIVPGSQDEVIIKALRKKIDLSAIINRDNYKKWRSLDGI